MSAQIFTPNYSHITGLLQQLNDEELRELLNNDEKLKAIVNDLKQVNDIEAEREMLIAGNKSISEYNLSRKPILELHRKQVEDTHKIALELKNSFLEKKKKIESCQKETSKDTILALLQAATSEVEEEAEKVVEFFLKNEISIEDFLEKYLELRKVAHLRRIKTEKLLNILQGQQMESLTPPIKPQRFKTPPLPPVSRSELPYPKSSPNQSDASYVPIRTAPQPPANSFQYPLNMYPQNSGHPMQPYRYPVPPSTGYFMPRPQYPRY